ncbi:MAG: elongation factor G [Acidobacteria bacterium]|nr:MAG: elongation factor G [Acidobacteriota bacterium]PIE90538.1 MAG: elongation factor G [Acidobacteriota bacterium]
MKAEDVRNVGIVGHGGVGKTLLAEAMLYNAGVTNRMGSIEDGNTVSDFHGQEIDRQFSISTTMMHLPWEKHKVNIIDAPGYLDFIGEVYGAMHVLDIGLITIDASSGIEVGTEIAWQYGKEHDLSKFFVINKMEKDDIQYDKLVDELKDAFGSNVILAQFPYDSGENFHQIIDLIRGKLLVYPKDGNGKYTEKDIPADAEDKYDQARMEFMESIIEHDEELMEKYLGDEEVSEDEIKRALSHAVKHNEVYPVVCCSAKSNVGVSRILELIVKYGASASDLPDVHGKNEKGEDITRKCSKDEPMSSLIFKTISEPHVGELSFVKVFSGTLAVGDDVYNPNENSTERISGLYVLNGKTRTETDKLECGDMGAIIKLKNSHTNQTLCAKNSPIIIDPIVFPDPVIRSALHVVNKGDEDKVSVGLGALHQEDPTFHFAFDPELRQTIVSGQGELQLDIIGKRLKNRFNVAIELERPNIPYRETISKKTEVRKRYKKQSGGRGQFGEVQIEVMPRKRGEGFEFINNIVGGSIPTKFIPAVEKGIVNTMSDGYLIGCKIVDVAVRLFDGSFHAVDSSDMSFQIAGSMAFKEAMDNANPIILEPYYTVEIKVPEEYLGSVMGDISTRRGKLQGMDSERGFQIIKAQVPLSELYKYSSTLRSLTQGRGRHTSVFSHYEPVPKDIQNQLREAYDKEKEEE